LDWLVGGPSNLIRHNLHPTQLYIGVTIDSWRVIGLELESRLTLELGMRVPGSGIIE